MRAAIGARPLVQAALAVLAGAWIGLGVAESGLDPAQVRALRLVAPALALGAWLAGRLLKRGPGPGTLALLCLASFAAAQTAAPRAPAGVDALTGGIDGHGAALAGPAALEAVPAGPTLAGPWRPLRATGRGVLGRIEHPARHPAWLELPRGVAREGEWLEVEPIDAPRREARGPELPPRAPGEAGGLVLWSARADEVRRLSTASEWDAATEWLAALRSHVERRCDRFEAGTSRSLARALLYGDTAGLDPNLAAIFSRTGQKHVLAVSGMHVSLLAAVLLAPLLGRTGRRGRIVVTLGTGVVLALFAGLTGGNAPVRRAAVALALALAAPLCVGTRSAPRRPDTLSLIGVALLVEAALDVRALFSVSLLLSYAATLGLVLLTRDIARALCWTGRGIELGPTTLRRAAFKAAGRAGRAAVATSLAAVFATLPLTWGLFGEWAPIGTLVTAATTPLVAWMLVLGWLAVLVPVAAAATAFDAAALLYARGLELADLLPGTPSVLPPRPALLLVLATVLTSWGWLTGGLRSGLARSGLALAALLLLPWTARPSGWVLDVLDVGHGTCAVLRGPRGPTWVYDAGSRDRARVGPAALGPLLAAAETGAVAVVLSHPDSDHAEALDWLGDRYPLERWLGAASARSAERRAHTAGRIDPASSASALAFELDSSARGTLVRGLADEDNEGSRTWLVSLPGARLALHGDAVREGLLLQLGSEALLGPVDVLLWPHHGDASEWSDPLLAQSAPAEVWISGSGPPPIAAELDRRGVRWRSTALEGPLRRVWPAQDPGALPGGGHGSRSPSR